MSDHICDFPRVSQTGRACPYCTIRELEQRLTELREAATNFVMAPGWDNEDELSALESVLKRQQL